MYNRDQVSVIYEIETPPAPRTDLGPYRRADYLALPDEPRCELVYGRLLVMTAPTLRHQRVVGRVFQLLLDFADRAGGQTFVAPVDVALADHSIVQPDILYVGPARTSILSVPRVEGAPDLVVEVLSPGTARRDLGEKLRLYGETGVLEYWIVDPGLGTFEFLEKANDGFRVRLPDGGVYRSSLIADLELDLEKFWRSVDLRRPARTV